jgi:predicted transposase/invertase (TIGR01784 family)
MTVTKFLDPKNDYAFKRIFGTEKHKNILIHFLNDILHLTPGVEIQDVTFLKPIQDPEIVAKKQSIVDVLCKDEKGFQYIVEMQVARTSGFVKRAQYYAAKAYTNQMNNGDLYQNLKQVIFVAITDFVMFPEKPGYKSDHVILDKGSYAHDLKDFSFTFLELPKFTKTIDELETHIEKWMYFFKHATHTDPEELEKITGSDMIIGQAYKVLDQYYWSEEELCAYEREKKSELDAKAMLAFATNSGKAEGLIEGEAIGIKRVAKNMLLQGIGIQTITAVTGLSEEEIRSFDMNY